MLISIEGNIGSGKSTFCKYLKEHFSHYYNKPHGANVYFLDEPVDTWLKMKDSTGNLLEHFYKNPEKYSYCFQMTAYISRLVNLKNILKKSKRDDIIIMERSVFSDCNVFANMLHSTGKINSIEYQSYNMWFDSFLDDIPEILFVYLKTDFTKCHERVLERAREGEEPITLEYLKECDKWHNHWFKNYPNTIIFDGNLPTTHHPEFLDILKQMMNYKTNVPENFNINDSDNEYYYEARHDHKKWHKRLYDKTLTTCQKRARSEES